MLVIRHLGDQPAELKGAAVAIGNFDGVHRGHHAVIGAAKEAALAAGAATVVVTFEPHPRRLFRPDDPPFRLTPLRTKLAVLASLGVDAVLVLKFDRAFAAQDAEAFVSNLLVGALGACHVAIGVDFCFGRNRAGNAEFLAARAGNAGFGVTAVPPHATAEGEVFSSTAIRTYLEEGRPRDAARLLGRRFAISGHVRSGDKRGRTLGFPTANLRLEDILCPARGVYAVIINHGGRRLPGVANIGERPTVDGRDLRLEAHLFDFNEDLYGQRLEVELVDFIRPEARFSGLDALKAQIVADSETARRLLAAEVSA